jgi:integrase
MSLYKRGTTWWSRIEYHGVIHQQSLRTKSKNVAIELEAALKTSLITGVHQTVKNAPTLIEFETRLFAHLKIHVKARSLQFYKEQYDVLTKSPLGKLRLSLIDAAAVDVFKQWRQAQGVAVITVNHAIRTLRRALHQAEEWHLISRAPKLKLMPGENSREAVVAEIDLTRMIEYAQVAYPRSVFQFLLPVLVDTGLRISEACRLKRDDVFLGKKPKPSYLTVTEGKSKYSKREVPLTSRAVTAIEAAWSRSRCPYIFTAYGGRRPLTRHYATQQFRLLADALRMTPDTVLHSTRHTFCTRLGESGADAFTIQKLAGHSSITISQRYVHQGKVIAQNAIGRMEELSKKEPERDYTNTTPPGEVTEI